MNIYTKTGDSGETSLYGGSRVSKDSLRLWCYGTMDEASGVLGVIHASTIIPKIKNIVRDIQRKIFVLNSELASDEKALQTLPVRINGDDVTYLEGIIDEYTRDFGRITGFSIPGETVGSALFHVARTVVRRCERHVAALAKEEYVSPDVLKYINRLSDTLFVLGKIEVFEMFVKQVAEKVASAIGINNSDGWTEETCSVLYRAAESESKKLGVPISFAMVDDAGTMIYFYSQPGALLASVGVAQNKAYTSVAMRMSTDELSKITKPGDSLFGLNTADPKIVLFGGGFPLFQEGRLTGAFGVAGGSVAEDVQIGKVVLKSYEMLKLDA